MRIHGKKHRYQSNFMKLEEIGLICEIEDLDKLIGFLSYIKENCKDIVAKKNEVIEKNDICETFFQYRDWDETWKENKDTDIVIVIEILESKLKNRKKDV